MTSFTSKPCSGSDGQQRRRARAEQRVLVHDHHRARRLAGGLVQRRQVLNGALGTAAIARPEAKGVLQPALDDLVGHAHVDHMGQPVALAVCVVARQIAEA